MSPLFSLRKLFGRGTKSSNSARRQPRIRPLLELLEERLVPTTLDVNPTGAGGAYSSIQAAVTAASAGDTIVVAAGTYNETVTVNKSLTLEGAQYGVDARTHSGPETIVDGANGDSTAFNISASNVKLDGFTVQNQTTSYPGAGIYIEPKDSNGAFVSGTHITDDIVQNNTVGLFLANGGTSPTKAVIQDDLFQNNNQSGASFGTAIYQDQYTSGGPLKNVLIDSNSFVNNHTAGIGISDTDTANPDSNLTISNNSFNFKGQANAIYLFDTTSSSITGNTITSTGGNHSAAIALVGNVKNLSITNNEITGVAGYGIYVATDEYTNYSPNKNVTVNNNDISGFTQADIDIESGGYVGTLNAQFNYFGSPNGPPAGSIVGNVDYTPFLVSPINTATQRVYSDSSGDTLVLDSATGDYSFTETNGTSFTGSNAHINLKQNTFSLQTTNGNGQTLKASGYLNGAVSVSIRGNHAQTQTVTLYYESNEP